ncbi:Nitronate monooxygenase [Mycobacterium tuberculosis]|nr:Nitronate monooxygenase [Mycobacterium tuberculosis]
MDDPDGTTLWAGTAYREACAGPVADIVASLNPDMRGF